MTDSPHVRTVDGMRLAFGRVEQWDDRNARHLAAPAPRQHPDRARVMHRAHLPILDQQDVGACEAFQGVDALGCTPLWRGQGQDLIDRTNATDTAFRWYDLVTHDDEFDGAWSYGGDPRAHPLGSGDDTGTSTLALCRMLKARGLITRYEWITGERRRPRPAPPRPRRRRRPRDRHPHRLGMVTEHVPARPRRHHHRPRPGHRRARHHPPRVRPPRTPHRRPQPLDRDWGNAGEYAIRFEDVANRMAEGGDQAVIYRS
jgi:hypothetical protein